jgi:PAS domain S-box-containing protein
LIVGLSYLVIAGAYIVLSSTFLAHEHISRENLVALEILKGLLFVTVTSVILFLVVYRYSRHLEQRGKLLDDALQVAGVPVMIMDADPPYRLLRANGSAEQMLELPRGRAAGMPGGEILERLFPREPAWRDVLAGDRPTAEWIGIIDRSDAGPTPVEARIRRMPFMVGRKPLILAVLFDISDQQHAQDELARRERRFHLAMAQYPFPAGICGLDERLTFVNDAFTRVTGLREDQMLGKTYEELSGPNAGPAIAMVRDAMKTGDIQTEIMHDDFGDPPLVYEVMATPLKAADGRVLEVLVMTRDMSEHIRREEAVRRQERTLWALIEALPIPVSLSRHETGDILVANRAFHDLYELNGDLSALIAVDSYQNRSDRDLVDAEFAERGFVEARELQLKTAAGKPITVIANIIPFEYEGGVCRLSAVVDVTDLRATEKALIHAQRLEAVGRLTGGLAHDFNNLLMTIQISLDLLREELPANIGDVSLIETALKAVQRGGDLTHRLLAFSRQQLLKPQRIDLNQRIKEVYPLLRSSVGDTVSIDLELDEDLWPALLDGAQFDTTVLNLVINARDAMAQGGKVTLVSANVTLEGGAVSSVNGDPMAGEFVKISVIDEGHGIDAEVRQNLFEPFFTTKVMGKGTGLGLSMVYGFVQQSGGLIDLESAPGKGAAFHLFFPRATMPAARDVPRPSVKPAPVPEIGAEKLLVLVDDDEALRRTMTRVLEQAGLRVRAFPDAHAALAMLQTADVQPDIVLTDVALPGNFNGLQFAGTVRRMMPECRILCMTGHVDPDEIADLGDIADFEIMHKPFPLAHLTDRIRALLAMDGAEQAAGRHSS